jgi:hypothetical protein
MDPQLEITVLDSFNHTYRPDMIITWGRTSGKRERPVYLRLIAGGPSTMLDVESLGDRKPLMLGLLHHRLNTEDEEIAQQTEAVAAASAGTTLVTNASAFDQLDVDEASRVPTVATSALLRNGTGVLGTDHATELRTSVRAGYDEAISAGDPDKVDQAAEALRPFLSDGERERVDLYLDLLWFAAGGDLELLDDGHRLLHADFKPNEWALLLREFLAREDKSDKQLWQLLGNRLTLDAAAAAVAEFDNPRHLDDFVKANAERWKARYAGYLAHPDVTQTGWWISDGAFALGRGKSSIAFTASKAKAKKAGAPLARRAFDDLRKVMRADKLITLDARDGETTITLSGGQALPVDRVDQVVEWTKEIQALSVDVTAAGEQFRLSIDYSQGKLNTDRDIPLKQLRGRAVRYLDVRSAAAGAAATNPDG